MKKRFIVVVLFLGVLILCGVLYWSGYLVFNGPLPSFNPNPGTTQSNETAELEGTPKLLIENIKGRFNKISADIENTGDQDAKSIAWSISVEGGILKQINLHSTGTLDTLSKGSSTTITSDRVPLGLGRLEITVTVEVTQSDTVTQSAQGFKLFFFVLFD